MTTAVASVKHTPAACKLQGSPFPAKHTTYFMLVCPEDISEKDHRRNTSHKHWQPYQRERRSSQLLRKIFQRQSQLRAYQQRLLRRLGQLQSQQHLAAITATSATGPAVVPASPAALTAKPALTIADSSSTSMKVTFVDYRRPWLHQQHEQLHRPPRCHHK